MLDPADVSSGARSVAAGSSEVLIGQRQSRFQLRMLRKVIEQRHD